MEILCYYSVDKYREKELSKLIVDVRKFPNSEHSIKKKKTYAEALLGGKCSPQTDKIIPVTKSNDNIATKH